MSELLDKQVNAQKEKNFQGSHKSTKKVCDEKEEINKEAINDAHVKMFLMEENGL